jgi:hypothetical protein
MGGLSGGESRASSWVRRGEARWGPPSSVGSSGACGGRGLYSVSGGNPTWAQPWWCLLARRPTAPGERGPRGARAVAPATLSLAWGTGAALAAPATLTCVVV